MCLIDVFNFLGVGTLKRVLICFVRVLEDGNRIDE